MTYLVVDASQQHPEAQLVFFSPDTDLVLVFACYGQLCKITMVLGNVDIQPIWTAWVMKKPRLSYLHSMLSPEQTTLADSQE